jgi:hypothetical protein
MSLRTALKLDALVTGANAAAYLVAAGPLEDLLGLSPALLRGTGAFLLLFSAAVWTLASRPRVSPSAALVVIALNVLWAADSIAFLATGVADPTTAGAVWIVMQAVVVAGFASLQTVTRGAARNRAVAA